MAVRLNTNTFYLPPGSMVNSSFGRKQFWDDERQRYFTGALAYMDSGEGLAACRIPSPDSVITIKNYIAKAVQSAVDRAPGQINPRTFTVNIQIVSQSEPLDVFHLVVDDRLGRNPGQFEPLLSLMLEIEGKQLEIDKLHNGSSSLIADFASPVLDALLKRAKVWVE